MVRPFARHWVVLALAVFGGCSSPPPRPNVVMVVIDTLRADKLGAYGDRRGLTPFLDQLAQRGTLFEHAYATSSWTVPSVASLFTSRYPSQHGVVTFGQVIAEQEITFAERLRDAGWMGAGYSANPNLQVRLGHAQGFAEWLTPETVDGDALRTGALAWLDRTWRRDAAAPAFLYFQYMEPHEPYEAREPFRGRFAVDDAGQPIDLARAIVAAAQRIVPDQLGGGGAPVDTADAARALLAHGMSKLTRADFLPAERLYDACVAEADDQVGRLFAELERRGFLDRAVVIVTADHGEEFFEHGRLSHGQTLFEGAVQVPLIVVGPGIPAGRREAENVALVDVAPTLLDLLRLEPEPRFEGRSLLPLLAASAPSQARGGSAVPDVLMELKQVVGGQYEQRLHTRGLLRGSSKLLVERDPERAGFYDLAADPDETRRDPPGSSAASAILRRALDEWQTQLGRQAGPERPRAALDEKTRERLRALGYKP